MVLSGKKPPLLEDLPLRELLLMLVGEEGRRRLELRQMTNDALFELYDADLVVRMRNQRNLANFRALLRRFRTYLGGFPPSKELAKGFLSQYADRKPRTFYTYATAIKTFMKWYGEPLEDFKVKLPKSLPPLFEFLSSHLLGLRQTEPLLYERF